MTTGMADHLPHSGPGRDRAYFLLLKGILQGELPPDSRLMEQQLADGFELSRTPLREALFRLEHEGFVQTELRRGFRVAPLTETEARQIYPIIGALEALAISESGTLVATMLSTLVAANEDLAKAINSPGEALHADEAFHRALVAECMNVELNELLERYHLRAIRYEQLFMRESSLIERSVSQHQAIIKAVAGGDIGAAQSAVEANYQTGMESVIAKLRNTKATG